MIYVFNFLPVFASSDAFAAHGIVHVTTSRVEATYKTKSDNTLHFDYSIRNENRPQR